MSNRTYFAVENSNRDFQIYAMNVIGVLSTVCIALLSYLIFSHSKKERMSSKMVAFLHNLSFYLSDLHFGTIANLVFLFPFPGLYSIGFASDLLPTFWSMAIWAFFLGIVGLTMFLEIFLRLKAIARPGKCFDWKMSTYTFLVSTVCLEVYVPASAILIYFYETRERTEYFVKEFYPTCLKVFNHPGVFVFTNTSILSFFVIGSPILLLFLISKYLFFCFAIIYEIRQQNSTTSVATIKYHLKVLKDIVTQNTFRGVFVILPSVMFPLNDYFFQPEDDIIKLSSSATIFFASAPIPCSILIFVQKKSFHSFFQLRREERVGSINNNNIHRLSS